MEPTGGVDSIGEEEAALCLCGMGRLTLVRGDQGKVRVGILRIHLSLYSFSLKFFCLCLCGH